MNIKTDLIGSDFWSPEFEIETRDDGTIVMRQADDLTGYLPTLADYLDKWADQTPDQPWIARRGADDEWERITYGTARDQARRIGGALLSLGLGPDRPLLILSENSLEHALLGGRVFLRRYPLCTGVSGLFACVEGSWQAEGYCSDAEPRCDLCRSRSRICSGIGSDCG